MSRNLGFFFDGEEDVVGAYCIRPRPNNGLILSRDLGFFFDGEEDGAFSEEGDDLVDGGFELVFLDGGAQVGMMGGFKQWRAAMKQRNTRILLDLKAL